MIIIFADVPDVRNVYKYIPNLAFVIQVRFKSCCKAYLCLYLPGNVQKYQLYFALRFTFHVNEFNNDSEFNEKN